MREILFRAKDNAKEWRYGFLTAQFGYGVDDFDLQILTQSCGELCYIDPDTVGQYTGLDDKNGIKIFEGDIVTIGVQPWEVIWGSGCFELRQHDNWFAFSYWAAKSEVLGNVYDKPESLP